MTMETLTNSSLQHYYNEIDPDDMPDLGMSLNRSLITQF